MAIVIKINENVSSDEIMEKLYSAMSNCENYELGGTKIFNPFVYFSKKDSGDVVINIGNNMNSNNLELIAKMN